MGKLVAECDRDGEQTLGTLEHGELRQLKPSLISAPALFSLVSSLREKEKERDGNYQHLLCEEYDR